MDEDALKKLIAKIKKCDSLAKYFTSQMRMLLGHVAKISSHIPLAILAKKPKWLAVKYCSTNY
jgi:hypothetical protein